MQNLQHEPIYLWSGRSDLIVQQTATNELRSFHRDFAANVLRYANQFPAGPGWESPYGLVPCNRTRTPLSIFATIPPMMMVIRRKCGLASSSGRFRPRVYDPLHSKVLTFDQTQFAAGRAAATISMADTGYVFVPQSCANGSSCGLVLALHGCAQSSGAIGETFAYDAGIN